MSEPRDYVQPPLSDARVERLWANVSERLEKRPGRAFRWAVLSFALAGVAAGGALFGTGTLQLPGAGAPAALTEAKLESGAEGLAVKLVDGSALKLASRTSLQVHGGGSKAVLLALGRGQITCDVPHEAERKFSVTAGDVEVRVVGTEFSVKLTEGANPDVVVSVLRGVVEVVTRRKPGVVSRVAAGQSWSERAASAFAAAAAALPTKAAAPEATPAAELAASGASAKPDAPDVGPSTATSAAPALTGPTARELFEKAGERRRAGDAAAAAQAYEELLRLHPSDGRASLSAFELGRLRMDRLGDASGAISALERALALNVGPSFREDALARLVSIYALQGNFGACGRARDRYLSSYPAGVHAAAVTTRCGAR